MSGTNVARPSCMDLIAALNVTPLTRSRLVACLPPDHERSEPTSVLRSILNDRSNHLALQISREGGPMEHGPRSPYVRAQTYVDETYERLLERSREGFWGGIRLWFQR